MTVELKDDGVLIEDGSYAIVFSSTGDISTVVPQVDNPDEPLTNGHMLILGLARKLQDGDWVKDIIDETSTYIQKAHELVQLSETTKSD